MSSFYERREWKELRYKILNKHGWKCMACNISRTDGAIMNVDHIKPVSIHPELALSESNLQVLCKDCNLGKSNKSSERFIKEEKQKRYICKYHRRQPSKEKRRFSALARLYNGVIDKLKQAEAEKDAETQSRMMRAYLGMQRNYPIYENLKLFEVEKCLQTIRRDMRRSLEAGRAKEMSEYVCETCAKNGDLNLVSDPKDHSKSMLVCLECRRKGVA